MNIYLDTANVKDIHEASARVPWTALPLTRHQQRRKARDLRITLWMNKRTSRRYSTFLDYAASLLFRQKVGGGYIFIHRLVMEHFARLDSKAKDAMQ